MAAHKKELSHIVYTVQGKVTLHMVDKAAVDKAAAKKSQVCQINFCNFSDAICIRLT